MRNRKARRGLVRKKKKSTLPSAVIHQKHSELPADVHTVRVQDGKPLQRLKTFAKALGDDPLEDSYDSLFGCRPTTQLLSTDHVQLAHIKVDVRRGLMRETRTEGMQLALQIRKLGQVSGARAEVAVKALKARSGVFQKIGVSSMSALVFVDMPDPTEPAGFVIEVQERSLLYGPGIRHDIEVAKRAAKASSKPVATVEWIDIADKKSLKKAVGAVITPPLVGDPASRAAAAQLGDGRWMKRASIRAFVILQIRSMLPLKMMLGSQGNGRIILDAALKAAESRVKQAAKGEAPPIPRDGMIHFWFRELRRLGLDDFTVPLVKLH